MKIVKKGTNYQSKVLKDKKTNYVSCDCDCDKAKVKVLGHR